MKPKQAIPRLANYLLLLALLVVSIAGYHHLRLPLDRVPDGVREIGVMLGQRMFPPDLVYASVRLLHLFLYTFAMAFFGTIFGFACSVSLPWVSRPTMTPCPPFSS